MPAKRKTPKRKSKKLVRAASMSQATENIGSSVSNEGMLLC